MSIGLPVVLSNIDAHRELLAGISGGKLFDDSETAASILSELLADPTKRSELGAALRTAVDGFSWRVTAQRYSEIFQEVLEKR